MAESEGDKTDEGWTNDEEEGKFGCSRKILECAICLEVYNDPKALQFSHEYCKRCVEEIAVFQEDGSLVNTCPMRCDRVTALPQEKTVKDLVGSFIVKNILSTFRSAHTNPCESFVPKCTLSESCCRQISRYCCDSLMCVKCHKAHLELAGSGLEHRLYNLWYDIRTKKLAVLCEEHSTHCTHLCEDYKFLCVYCIHRDRQHMSHEKSKVETEVDHLRETLRKEVRAGKDLLEQSLALTKENVSKARERLRTMLQDRKEECIRKYRIQLETQETNLIHNFDSITKVHVDSYDDLNDLKYFQELLAKLDIELALRKREVLNTLQRNKNSLVIDHLAVILSEQSDDHPLGDLNHTVARHSLVFPTSSFNFISTNERGNMEEVDYATPATSKVLVEGDGENSTSSWIGTANSECAGVGDSASLVHPLMDNADSAAMSLIGTKEHNLLNAEDNCRHSENYQDVQVDDVEEAKVDDLHAKSEKICECPKLSGDVVSSKFEKSKAIGVEKEKSNVHVMTEKNTKTFEENDRDGSASNSVSDQISEKSNESGPMNNDLIKSIDDIQTNNIEGASWSDRNTKVSDNISDSNDSSCNIDDLVTERICPTQVNDNKGTHDIETRNLKIYDNLGLFRSLHGSDFLNGTDVTEGAKDKISDVRLRTNENAKNDENAGKTELDKHIQGTSNVTEQYQDTRVSNGVKKRSSDLTVEAENNVSDIESSATLSPATSVTSPEENCVNDVREMVWWTLVCAASAKEGADNAGEDLYSDDNINAGIQMSIANYNKQKTPYEAEQSDRRMYTNLFSMAGAKFFEEGDYQQSFDSYSKAIEACPSANKGQLSSLYISRGSACEALKDWAGVVEDCSNSIKLNNKSSLAYHQRARAYEALNEKKKSAHDIMLAVFTGHPDKNPSVIAFRDSVLQSLCEDLCEEFLKQARTPPFPSAYKLKGHLLQYSYNIFTIPETSSEADSNYCEIMRALKKNKFGNVFSLCDREISSSGRHTGRCLLLRATFNFLMDNIDAVLKDLNDVILLPSAKDDTLLALDAHLKMADVQFFELKNSARCFNHLECAMKLDKYNATIYFFKGIYLQSLGRIKEARKNYAVAKRLDSNFVAPWISDLGACFGDGTPKKISPSVLKEAAPLYDETIQKFPNCPRVRWKYGVLLCKLGKTKEAHEMMNAAIALDPKWPEPFADKARIYYSYEKNVVQAKKWYLKSIELDKKQTSAFHCLGKISTQEGNYEDAYKYLQKALSLSFEKSRIVDMFKDLEYAKAMEEFYSLWKTTKDVSP